MGITGLLPFLEKSSIKTNIKEFSGSTVAIDTYCWLHKGVFSCAEKLLMGQTTNAYVLYCMKYINMLLKCNIKPILVFDGRQLPAKKQTEIKRRETRQMNRCKGTELIRMGQVAEGRNLLRRAIDITHEIALELIKHCQNENIDCIVAPYEADAQLAYLNISGIADIVITEDSDLTLFGCKKIFFKMDFNGNGILVEQDRLHLALDVSPEQFHMDKFRYICILSGCDYLPSLPGIGLGKARKFIAKNTDHDIHRALTRLGSILNIKSLVVTPEYRDAFILADITFKHQLVFCPLQKKQVRLNPPTADITEDQLKYAGKELNADLALQLALGNCDPSSLKMLHDFHLDKIEQKRKRNMETGQIMIRPSIWSNGYELRGKNHVSSPKNAVSSAIIAAKELVLQRDSLKDEVVSSKLHNSPITKCDKHLDYQDLNETVLDIYNCQSTKLIANSDEQESEQSLYTEKNDALPELLKQRNPFVKQVSNLKTSPSVLSNGNCRNRGKNLMRIRRTIIDENTIIESRYFSKQDNKKHDILELENNIEDADLRNVKYNTILDSTATYDSEVSENQLETSCVPNTRKNASLLEDISVKLLTNRNECLINSCESISGKSSSNDEITGISPTTFCAVMDKNHISDNLSTSSSTNIKLINNFITYGNTCTSKKNLSNLSPRTNNNQVSSHKRLKNLKKRCSSELISHGDSISKRIRQGKHLSPVSSQQNLLSMYGFQKRPSFEQ